MPASKPASRRERGVRVEKKKSGGTRAGAGRKKNQNFLGPHGGASFGTCEKNGTQKRTESETKRGSKSMLRVRRAIDFKS